MMPASRFGHISAHVTASPRMSRRKASASMTPRRRLHSTCATSRFTPFPPPSDLGFICSRVGEKSCFGPRPSITGCPHQVHSGPFLLSRFRSSLLISGSWPVARAWACCAAAVGKVSLQDGQGTVSLLVSSFRTLFAALFDIGAAFWAFFGEGEAFFGAGADFCAFFGPWTSDGALPGRPGKLLGTDGLAVDPGHELVHPGLVGLRRQR